MSAFTCSINAEPIKTNARAISRRKQRFVTTVNHKVRQPPNRWVGQRFDDHFRTDPQGISHRDAKDRDRRAHAEILGTRRGGAAPYGRGSGREPGSVKFDARKFPKVNG